MLALLSSLAANPPAQEAALPEHFCAHKLLVHILQEAERGGKGTTKVIQLTSAPSPDQLLLRVCAGTGFVSAAPLGLQMGIFKNVVVQTLALLQHRGSWCTNRGSKIAPVNLSLPQQDERRH